MKTILKELGLTWTKTEEKYKAWKEQFQTEQMQGGKRDFTLPLSKAQVKIGKHNIPLSMIDYFQKTAIGEDKREPWEKALEHTKIQERVIAEELPELKDTNWYTGIRLNRTYNKEYNARMGSVNREQVNRPNGNKTTGNGRTSKRNPSVAG